MKFIDEAGVIDFRLVDESVKRQFRDPNRAINKALYDGLFAREISFRESRERASAVRLKLTLAAAYLIVKRLEPDFRESRKKASAERWSSK